MFSAVINTAKNYTKTVLVNLRYSDGTVGSSVGSFIYLNDEGHFISARHLFLFHTQLLQDQKYKADYLNEVSKIEGNRQLSLKQKNNQKKALEKNNNRNWLENISYFLDFKYSKISFLAEDVGSDLVVGKIDDYKPGSISIFPKFLKSSFKELSQATSLCRLGFAFSQISCSFNSETKSFNIDLQKSQAPYFPNDGILTRYINSNNNGVLGHYIETSTPGIKGQSGGPILSINGVVVAIQSQTQMLDLDFVAKKKIQNNDHEEHLFLPVGWGSSHNSIAALLEKHLATKVSWADQM